MKKSVVALILASSIAAIAYATVNRNTNRKQVVEKKQIKEQKKECKRTCMFG